MITAHFYDVATGVFTGQVFRGNHERLLENTPAGCAPWCEPADPRRQRVDLVTGALAEHRPPELPADALQTWRWDETAWRWMSQPTEAALAAVARAQRGQLIAATDWTENPAAQARIGPEKTAAFQAYRQALFDLPKQPGFPQNITWPQIPT